MEGGKLAGTIQIQRKPGETSGEDFQDDGEYKTAKCNKGCDLDPDNPSQPLLLAIQSSVNAVEPFIDLLNDAFESGLAAVKIRNSGFDFVHSDSLSTG